MSREQVLMQQTSTKLISVLTFSTLMTNQDRYTTTNHGSFNKFNENYNHSNNDYSITDNSQRTSDDAELHCQVADIHRRLYLQTLPMSP